MIDKKGGERKAWLATLAVGDEVAVTRNSWGGASYGIVKIERLTATQFVMDGDIRRYRRDSGVIVGEGRAKIQPITPEIRENIELVELARWLGGLTSNHRVKASLKQLRAMKTAYDEVSK